MTVQLSRAARTALHNVGTSRQGTLVKVPPGPLGRAVQKELAEHGLIGMVGGLTRKGGIVRDRLVTASVESAFN